MTADPMDLQPFFVEVRHDGANMLAEVKPCCQQDNVIFYDIWFNNTYGFTITQNTNTYEHFTWKIALVNADKQVDPMFVENIGQQIEKQMMA